MKAFRFRLESVLRWRETQTNLAKSEVAAAAEKLANLRAEAVRISVELSGSARRRTAGATGESLHAFDAYRLLATRQISHLASAALTAEKELAEKRVALAEARRREKVIGNLRERALAEWNQELTRETDAFAGEAFLARIQWKKRAGA